MRGAIGSFFLVLALQQLGAAGGVVAAASGSTGLRDGALPGEPTSAAIAVSTPHTGVSRVSSGSSSGSASSSSSFSSTASLLAYLNGLSGQSRHILSGQHTNYWDSNPMDIVTPIPSGSGGKQVAILGTSNDWTGTGVEGLNPTASNGFVTLTNAWLAQGGIVLVSQSPKSPLANGEPYADVHTPGTAAYVKWHSFLDEQIAKFKQINGTVIWRPFIELNGKWSWWVPDQNQDQADFKIIWQQMHDYFAANGVNNILWLFNVNDWDSSADVTAWYPGSAYVDLVSLDAYPPGAKGDTPVYDALVATGKPVMYAEVGVHSSNNSSVSQHSYDTSTILATINANFPKIFAVVIWCQNYALPLQEGESAFM
ncbi:MAG: glycosyl hydrolase, partial [Steroidobacteraceae bacterium]